MKFNFFESLFKLLIKWNWDMLSWWCKYAIICTALPFHVSLNCGLFELLALFPHFNFQGLWCSWSSTVQDLRTSAAPQCVISLLRMLSEVYCLNLRKSVIGKEQAIYFTGIEFPQKILMRQSETTYSWSLWPFEYVEYSVINDRMRQFIGGPLNFMLFATVGSLVPVQSGCLAKKKLFSPVRKRFESVIIVRFHSSEFLFL